MFLKVIACEIAFREICYAAAQSQHVVELEFLPQGHHDTPANGRADIQSRIDAAPAGRYDALVLGYGLCSSILTGLTTTHTQLVIPRAHDCITFFLGSKERYQQFFTERPGTYYYTSGWLECARRRGQKFGAWGGASLPANAQGGVQAAYQQWVQKFGEDQAKYLMEEMSRWTEAYTHGTLIDFSFTKPLKLREQVEQICNEKGWQYDEVAGDLGLLRRMLEGDWPDKDFLIVRPGQKVIATFDEQIVGVAPAQPG